MGDHKICVIGIWHLGSVVSSCLAEAGYSVVGVDSNSERVQKLNAGVAPLYEPGLDELLRRNVESKRLSFTTDLETAVKDARYVLITFDTPVDAQDEVDVSEIFVVSRALGQCLENGAVVVVSSQVPVGTCDKIKSTITGECKIKRDRVRRGLQPRESQARQSHRMLQKPGPYSNRGGQGINPRQRRATIQRYFGSQTENGPKIG